MDYRWEQNGQYTDLVVTNPYDGDFRFGWVEATGKTFEVVIGTDSVLHNGRITASLEAGQMLLLSLAMERLP